MVVDVIDGYSCLFAVFADEPYEYLEVANAPVALQLPRLRHPNSLMIYFSMRFSAYIRTVSLLTLRYTSYSISNCSSESGLMQVYRSSPRLPTKVRSRSSLTFKPYSKLPYLSYSVHSAQTFPPFNLGSALGGCPEGESLRGRAEHSGDYSFCMLNITNFTKRIENCDHS